MALLEMHGQGRFYDPRLNDTNTFPVAARLGSGNITAPTDLVTAKLPALQFYQLALPVPEPPAGSFDAAAAARGKSLFAGKANCATCHTPALLTEPGWNLHTPESCCQTFLRLTLAARPASRTMAGRSPTMLLTSSSLSSRTER